MSSAPEQCIITNQYCPQCIPLVTSPLKDWQLDPRYGPLPERKAEEERIQSRLEKLRRKRALSVQAQREEIGKARRTA